MARTLLKNNITNVPSTHQLTVSSNCGQFIIDIDEATFTKKMERELSGIKFDLSVLVNSEQVPIENRSYLWNMGEDLSIPFYDVPIDCYVTITTLIDTRYQLPEGETLDTTFPVKVYFDSANVKAGGSGGGGDVPAEIYERLAALETKAATGVYIMSTN